MGTEFTWISASENVELNSDTLLLIKTPAIEQQNTLTMVMDSGARYCVTGMSNNTTVLVYTEHHLCLPVKDNVQHARLSLHPLCEIMAFLDESQQTPESDENNAFFLNTDISSYNELIYWFICCYLMGNASSDYVNLLERIRRQESYFLTSYLIKNRCSNEKINTLCERYGLSYSYFRKISKKYLGVSAKTKMSEWRLAQTILDLLEDNSSITDIALKNGYSSSAHVCSTFKSVLGMSPYAIRKINEK